jgi:hypothetical protein
MGWLGIGLASAAVGLAAWLTARGQIRAGRVRLDGVKQERVRVLAELTSLRAERTVSTTSSRDSTSWQSSSVRVYLSRPRSRCMHDRFLPEKAALEDARRLLEKANRS